MLGIFVALMVYLTGADGRMVGDAFAGQRDDAMAEQVMAVIMGDAPAGQLVVRGGLEVQSLAAHGLCRWLAYEGEGAISCRYIPDEREIQITLQVDGCVHNSALLYRIPGWDLVYVKSVEEPTELFRCPL